MFKKIIYLFFITFISFAYTSRVLASEVLQNLTKKYRTAQLVEMNVEKTVKSELLGKVTKYSGVIYLANGKFRWENMTPEKTLLVFDGATIWSEQNPPKELGGQVQVAKGKIDKKNRSHVLISSLLGSDINKNFKVTSETKNGDLLTLNVEPKNNGLSVNSIQLVMNPKSNSMNSISYKDDIGNLTTMNFSNVKFLSKSKNNLFKYQPPKGSQVSEL